MIKFIKNNDTDFDIVDREGNLIGYITIKDKIVNFTSLNMFTFSVIELKEVLAYMEGLF